MDISTAAVAAALQGMDILTGVDVLNRDCSPHPRLGPPDRSAASTTANPGYYHCCSRCADSGGGLHTRRCQRIHAARHGQTSITPSAPLMQAQTRPITTATMQVGPDTGATLAASSAASGLTGGYGTGHQGSNLDIIIDLTEDDDHPGPLNSLDATVTTGSEDTAMIGDTATDNNTAQPFSLPSFLQLMD